MVDFHGQRRTNDTHQSTTDPDARLYKKARGRDARLGGLGHLLMEHRPGLIVRTAGTPATGHGERDAPLLMTKALPGRHRITVAADKGYDALDFVTEFRGMAVMPHIAQYTRGRRSATDRRTTRHPGYDVSQRKRKLVEQGFDWIKGVAGLRKLRHRGGPHVNVGLHLHRGGVQHREAAPVAVGRGLTGGASDGKTLEFSYRNGY